MSELQGSRLGDDIEHLDMGPTPSGPLWSRRHSTLVTHPVIANRRYVECTLCGTGQAGLRALFSLEGSYGLIMLNTAVNTKFHERRHCRCLSHSLGPST